MDIFPGVGCHMTDSWKLGPVVAVSNILVVRSRGGRQATEYLSCPCRGPSLPAADAAATSFLRQVLFLETHNFITSCRYPSYCFPVCWRV